MADYAIHYNYDADKAASFDIALIKTKMDIVNVFEEERNMYVVNAICLPQVYISNKNDEFAQIAGFGILESESTESAPELRKTGGVIFSVLDSLKNYVEYHSILFYSGQSGTCSGDSGSPLFQYDGRRAVVIGVLGYGVLPPDEVYFGEERKPEPCGPYTVFARVSYFLSEFISPIIHES